MPDDLGPERTGCNDTDGAEGDLRYDTRIGEIQEREYQEDPPEEELRSLQEQEKSNIILVSIMKRYKKPRG